MMWRLLSRIMGQFRKFFYRRLLAIYHMTTYRSFEEAFGKPLRDWAPDIIHAHDSVTLPTAGHAARYLGARLVFDSHELETHRNPPMSRRQRRRVKRLERTYLPQADKVITVTNLIADYLAQGYRIPRPTVIYNSPPTPVLASSADLPNLRAEMDLCANDFIFVYTGQATLNRGLELAVIALEKLQGVRDPARRFSGNYHLAIVGNQSSHIVRKLAALAQQSCVGDKVHFLPPVPPQDVANYISTADASIIPVMPVTLSYEYAMPNKLFEAMLSGNPIIGADLMEMALFIAENRLGLTYQADSPDDCVEKMIDLIIRFPEFERSAEQQSELARKYAWEAQEKVLLAMYDDMLISPAHATSPSKGKRP